MLWQAWEFGFGSSGSRQDFRELVSQAETLGEFRYPKTKPWQSTNRRTPYTTQYTASNLGEAIETLENATAGRE